MKKVVVLLLVLTFGFTAAYADGVSFGAWTRTIYNVAAGSTDPNVNINQNMGPNWWAGSNAKGTAGLYASLSLNVQGAVLGYHIGWETDGGQLDTNPGHFLNFNVSVNMIPDLLTMTIGKISNDQFRVFKDATDDPNGDRNWLIGRFEVSGRSNLSHLSDGTKTGVLDSDGNAVGVGLVAAQLVLAPKDSGLAIGVYMPFNQGGSSSIQDNVDNLFVAASYTIASVGKITIGSTPKSNEFSGVYAGTRNIYLGFDLTAIKGFDLLIAGAYNINRYDNAGLSNSFQGNLGASFNVDIFSMGIALFFATTSQTNATSALGIDVNPSLNLGAVSVGVTAKFDLALYAQTPATGTTTLGYSFFPWVKVNAISTVFGFKYSGDNGQTASGAANPGTWSIPIAIDMGF